MRGRMDRGKDRWENKKREREREIGKKERETQREREGDCKTREVEQVEILCV